MPGKKKNPSKVKELPASVIVCPRGLLDKYRRHGINELDTYTMVFMQDGVYTSDASGIVSTVWSNNPSPASNWSTAVALYDEFRVLQHRVEFEPIKFNGQVLAQAPIAVVVDMDSSTALSSYVIGTEYSSDKMIAGGTRWTKDAYMSGSENSGFQSTTAPTATFWIKSYSSQNSVSITLGRFLVYYLVQFRGKGI